MDTQVTLIGCGLLTADGAINASDVPSLIEDCKAAFTARTQVSLPTCKSTVVDIICCCLVSCTLCITRISSLTCGGPPQRGGAVYSAGETYFIAANGQPRCALEVYGLGPGWGHCRRHACAMHSSLSAHAGRRSPSPSSGSIQGSWWQERCTDPCLIWHPSLQMVATRQ